MPVATTPTAGRNDAGILAGCSGVDAASASVFSSGAPAHRLPTPTEQTPSPYRSSIGVSANDGGGGGGGALGFAVLPSNGHNKDNDEDNDDGDDLRKATAGGGTGAVGGGGGSYGGGGNKELPSGEEGSGFPPGWRFLERGEGEESGGEDVVGGGGGRGGEAGLADSSFREELDVFSSSLRRDFELKVGENVPWLGSRSGGGRRSPPEISSPLVELLAEQNGLKRRCFVSIYLHAFYGDSGVHMYIY